MPETPRDTPPFSSQRGPLWYVICLALIGVAGVWTRAQLPAIPFADPDTWGYLAPGISHVSSGVFSHEQGRAFVYPLFVDAILLGFGSFTAIACVQYLLGFIAAGLLLRVWHRMFAVFALPSSFQTAHRVLGVMMAGSFLLSRDTIFMEHSIRPEAIFPFCAILAICFALEFCDAFFHRKLLMPAFWWGAALMFNAAALYFIKPSFGFAVAFVTLPVWIAVLQMRGRRLYRAGVVTLPLALAGALLWFPEHVLSKRFDKNADIFLTQHLLAFHAHILRKEIAAELEGRLPMAYDRQLLEDVAHRMDVTVHTPSPHFQGLGYNADDFIYTHSIVAVLMDFFQGDTARFNAFCMHYYWNAWAHRPLEMLGKITRQMVLFYSTNTPFDSNSHKIQIADRARKGLGALLDIQHPYEPYEKFRQDWAALCSSPQRWDHPRVVSWLNVVLRTLFQLASALAFLLFLRLGGRFFRHKPEIRGSVASALWLLYLVGFSFFNTLTCAVVHTVEVSRYVKGQLIYALLPACWAALLAAQWLIAKVRSQQQNDAALPVQQEQGPP